MKTCIQFKFSRITVKTILYRLGFNVFVYEITEIFLLMQTAWSNGMLNSYDKYGVS